MVGLGGGVARFASNIQQVSEQLEARDRHLSAKVGAKGSKAASRGGGSSRQLSPTPCADARARCLARTRVAPAGARTIHAARLRCVWSLHRPGYPRRRIRFDGSWAGAGGGAVFSTFDVTYELRVPDFKIAQIGARRRPGNDVRAAAASQWAALDSSRGPGAVIDHAYSGHYS